MKKYQVSIQEGVIRQNGVIVATISGMRGEKWVETIVGSTDEKPFGTDRKFFCRCKYANASASARDFAKWAFERFSVAEVVAFSESGKAPLEWANEQGYVCYNVRKAQRQTKQLTLLNNPNGTFGMVPTRLVCSNKLVTG